VANTIFQILSDFFARYGYWVVFFGVMLENLGLPVPGETVLLFAGFLTFQGKLHILPAILAAIAGATVGAGLGYWLGWCGRTSLRDGLLGRFPSLRTRYDDSQKVFLKHGQWAVFGARFVTGLRVFAGIVAGAMGMRFSTFLFFSFAGAICWSLAIGCVGFLFGSNWTRLVTFVGRINGILLVIIGGIAAALFLNRIIRGKKKS
jgi:membrane protein DedA with SNARE-associated domain